MTTPADLSGKLKNGFGSDMTKDQSVVEAIMRILLDNSAAGAKDFKTIRKLIEQITNKVSDKNDVKLQQLRDVITILSTEGIIDALDPMYLQARPKKPGDSPIQVTNLKQVIGNKFINNSDDQSSTVIMSRSPYVHPAKVATNAIDLFLNYMPPLVLPRLTPYLEVEFQTIRPAGEQLNAPGMLKFLLGAPNIKSMSTIDQVMLNARKLDGANGEELNFAGMEMFTSPQTLVNMGALSADNGLRYVNVLDPFVPFASLENFEITVTPAVGMYTYKSAKATMKIHDRTRLLEFSDLIRPKGYKDVLVWVTYGWIAPKDAGNEYFDFINKNMLRREAYGIVNSAFTFDQVGQITLNLELFTKGVQQAKTALISDSPTIAKVDELKKIGEEIASYRKLTLKDKPEGIGADLRIYQLLDSAQAGEFPDFSTNEINETIAKLRTSLSKSSNVDKTTLNKLIDALKKIYKNKDGKFDFKVQIENTVTALVADKFKECLTGPDPFLPSQEKADKGLVDTELAKEISKYNSETGNKTLKEFQHKLVSFGKLFSVFAIPSLMAQRTVNEIQVYFYAMNEQSGPISMHSLAEFPIDMPVFMDQYREMIVSKGGERITVEEFLQKIIESQFLDNRAIGYGLRTTYEPYDSQNRDAKVKENQEGAFESRIAAFTSKYGGFKLPAIEMHIEVMHRNNSEDNSSQSDLLSQLDTSAKEVQQLTTADIKNPNKAYTIMRIHLYDKQLSPYRELGSLFRNGSDGAGFAEIDKGRVRSEIVEKRFNQNNLSQQDFISKFIQPKSSNKKDGYVLIGNGSNQTLKDYLLNTVPKITFGANGTTVLAANLASTADPNLSTINMLKNNRVQNTVGPNGAGDYGLPLRVVPATLSLTTIGCPLFAMAQQYFFDAQTSTTLDNLYVLTGLSHTFQPGRFESTANFAFADAYGRFTSSPSLIDLFNELVPPEDEIDKKNTKR